MNSTRLIRRSRFFRFAILFAALAISGCENASDQGPAKEGAAGYYDGRNIRWIIPYSPGGGYDENARLIAPFLEKYTGARVDVINLPGAGGMRGANDLFNAPKNGLTIGVINGSALVMNELAGMRGADYRVEEFEYLGRIVADRRVLVVSLDSGYQAFEDLLAAGSNAKIGATGLGGSTYVDAVIINEAFDAGLDIIHGFDSSSVVRQAMLRGNIAGTWGSWGSAIDEVDQGQHRVLMQSGRERLPELADVPTSFELAGITVNPERTRAILSTWEALHEVGRPVAAPPGTPADRLEFLANAFDQALHDPELLEAARRSGRTIHYASAEQMRQIVTEATNMPDDIRQLFVSAIRGEL